MFANTQMGGTDIGFPGFMSPLRTLGDMARRTTDRSTLLVLQAGLQAMLSESKKQNVFVHDQVTAGVDLRYLESRTGGNFS